MRRRRRWNTEHRQIICPRQQSANSAGPFQQTGQVFSPRIRYRRQVVGVTLLDHEIAFINVAYHGLRHPRATNPFGLEPRSARHNDFRWDAILGSEIARDYKPKPVVYLATAEAFNLQPAQVMMVAAHSNDLEAAGQVGLRTGHIARPDEYGPNTGETGPTVRVDIHGSSLADLATKLGV